MVRGGKVSGKRNFRRRVWSKEGGSDYSDEDYVVSDDDRDVSDCSEDFCPSLDGFIEDEDEAEEEIQRVRTKTQNSVPGWRKNASKGSQKRGGDTYAEQLEPVEREFEGDEDDDDDDDDDDDFSYDEEEKFTAEEEDFSDEEEETRGRKKKNDGMKKGKKVLKIKVSVSSKRGRNRKRSRASKKPSRRKRRRTGGFRRKARCDDMDDFIDNDSAMRIESTKKPGRGRRRPLLEDSNSGSDCVSGSSDYEFTISEEEREQMREAKELCGSLRRNLRNSSILIENEEIEVRDSPRQQQKHPGRKGKDMVEEPKGRKGKEKVEDVKSEVGKQVCGICLSEEDKRRVRGVLNCCAHYFCFACIMEWSKVESRCPLCKQRFKTISKATRPTAASDSRKVVIQVPERDQVYQPSEEELRSYIDPYESVICSECHHGGEDALMLLCDICDIPAHTYCVGLGREVPEGNWYCDGCRPFSLGSSNSLIQESVADPRVTAQSQPVRSSPVLHVRESIDLNLISSPRTSFSHGFSHHSSSRLSGRSVEGASPISAGGAPTLSQRRRIIRHIQQLLSIDRLTSTTGISSSISATNSTSNLYSSRYDPSREPVAQHSRTRDVGTSYHTFFEERLCNNISPLMQNGGDPSSIRISDSRTPTIQDSIMFSNRSLNGELWPGLARTPTISDYEPVHQFCSRSNTVTDSSLPPAIKEESNFPIVKERLQSMVKSHLKRLSRGIDLGHSTFKEIAQRSTHTILAACGLEHKESKACTVPSPSACPHIELSAGGQTSLINGCCSSCFDSFVGDVVKMILDIRMSSQWLPIGH